MLPESRRTSYPTFMTEHHPHYQKSSYTASNQAKFNGACSYSCAIIEGRGKAFEVGLAILNSNNWECVISQVDNTKFVLVSAEAC